MDNLPDILSAAAATASAIAAIATVVIAWLAHQAAAKSATALLDSTLRPERVEALRRLHAYSDLVATGQPGAAWSGARDKWREMRARAEALFPERSIWESIVALETAARASEGVYLGYEGQQAKAEAVRSAQVVLRALTAARYHI